MSVIDSHLHLWDPAVLDYPWLAGALDARFSSDEIRTIAADGDRAVFVQADCREDQYLDEVRWVSEHADATGVCAIVAGARLDLGVQTSEHLEALAAHDLVVGVRHLLQSEPDGFAMSDAFLAGAGELVERGWTFDACVRASQLSDVIALAASVPALPIVLDHLGKPVIGTAGEPVEPSADWLRALAALAAHPQVFCKLSGMPAEADGRWSAAQVTPFLDAAAQAFGPERLMWGSDWPVSALDFADGAYRGSERETWREAVADWAASRGIDQDALFAGTAARFYGIR